MCSTRRASAGSPCASTWRSTVSAKAAGPIWPLARPKAFSPLKASKKPFGTERADIAWTMQNLAPSSSGWRSRRRNWKAPAPPMPRLSTGRPIRSASSAGKGCSTKRPKVCDAPRATA